MHRRARIGVSIPFHSCIKVCFYVFSLTECSNRKCNISDIDSSIWEDGEHLFEYSIYYEFVLLFLFEYYLHDEVSYHVILSYQISDIRCFSLLEWLVDCQFLARRIDCIFKFPQSPIPYLNLFHI